MTLFETGFLKRAASIGVPHHEAIGFLKQAQAPQFNPLVPRAPQPIAPQRPAGGGFLGRMFGGARPSTPPVSMVPPPNNNGWLQARPYSFGGANGGAGDNHAEHIRNFTARTQAMSPEDHSAMNNANIRGDIANWGGGGQRLSEWVAHPENRPTPRQPVTSPGQAVQPAPTAPAPAPQPPPPSPMDMHEQVSQRVGPFAGTMAKSDPTYNTQEGVQERVRRFWAYQQARGDAEQQVRNPQPEGPQATPQQLSAVARPDPSAVEAGMQNWDQHLQQPELNPEELAETGQSWDRPRA